MKAGIEEYVREGRKIPRDRPMTHEETLMSESERLKHLYDFTDEECFEYLRLRQQKRRNQVSQKLAELKNDDIEREAIRHAEEGINITTDSYSKLEHIVDTFKEMLDEKGKGSYEMTFEMTASKRSIGDGYPVIDDVLIPRQYVTSTRCFGPIDLSMLENEYDAKTKTLMGWAHSHCDMATFFSSVDRYRVENFPRRVDIPLRYNHIGDDKVSNVRYHPSIVVNNRHDDPFTTIAMDIPIYEATGPGTYRIKEYKRINVDDVPLNLIGEHSYERSAENTHDIQEKIKSRVSLGREDNYVGKLYDPDFKPDLPKMKGKPRPTLAELKRRVEGPREEENQDYAPSSEQESSYASNYAATDDLESLDWDDLNFDEIDSLDDL